MKQDWTIPMTPQARGIFEHAFVPYDMYDPNRLLAGPTERCAYLVPDGEAAATPCGGQMARHDKVLTPKGIVDFVEYEVEPTEDTPLVGEHAFEEWITEEVRYPLDRNAPCGFAVHGADNVVRRCRIPYERHNVRPPLPTEVLDKEPGMISDVGFMTSHKFGCAETADVNRGPCNCGYIGWNLGRVMWFAEHGLAGMAQLRPVASDPDVMTSTDFRVGYAGLERPTKVTVNGHKIGTWYPERD